MTETIIAMLITIAFLAPHATTENNMTLQLVQDTTAQFTEAAIPKPTQYETSESVQEDTPPLVQEPTQNTTSEVPASSNSEQLPANFTEWVPYNTSDMETLEQNLANGNVIYYNGQYWASPKYTNMLTNEIIVYQHDISQDM